jgi:hypothetical protein
MFRFTIRDVLWLTALLAVAGAKESGPLIAIQRWG